MDAYQDDALIQEFITESNDHLEAIEPDLLKMEEQVPEVDQEIVNSIFRAIHSIKGASGFFGFERLKCLSHVMESLLMRVRDGKLIPQTYMMEPLLKGVDHLREMVEDIHNSENVDTVALEKELEHYMTSDAPYDKSAAPALATTTPATPSTAGAPASPPESAMVYHFKADEKAVQRAKNIGQFLYVASVDSDKDLHGRSYDDFIKGVSSIGTVMNTTVADDEKDAPPVAFQVLFGTVLEMDLVPGALDLDDESVTEFSTDIMSNSADLIAALEHGDINPAKMDAKKAEEKVAAENVKAEAPATKNPATKAPAKAESHENDTIRVRVDLLNKLMDFAGELVLSRNQLIRATTDQAEKQGVKDENLTRVVQSLNTTTSYLQEHIMQTRMQPIEAIFRRFPRVVRDLSNQLGKKIQFEMIGQDVELDKTILESLSDPLTHMIRNCCDHGLETPDIRTAAGKDPVGKISLHAYHEGGQINLAITDDGNGIDTDRVGRKAIENGVLTQEQFDNMSHQERLNLIFHAGLSTADKVSDVSGRGVGMDVVRANIQKLGGHIQLDSELGKGSKVTLQLPLTLAIIPSLVVGLQEHRFAVPQVNLLELVRVRANEIQKKIEKVGAASVLRLRGRWLPLVKLSDVLALEGVQYINPYTQEKGDEKRYSIEDERFNDPAQIEQIPEVKRESLESDYNIVVLGVGANQYGLIVDEVFDTEEIVVKPLSDFLKDTSCFSGTSIMGDGKVAMICDVAGIANHSKLNFADVEAENTRRAEARAKRSGEGNAKSDESGFSDDASLEEQDRNSVILFSNHANEQFALPLGDLLRLERIKLSEIEVVGNREFVAYRGGSIPLVRLEDFISVRASEPDSDDAFMIIPKYGNGQAGIFATQILDTIEVDEKLNTHLIAEQQVSGSAVINDHLTLFIDAENLLNTAGVWVEGVPEYSHTEVVEV
jgi:two-component system, chemotaxis family, sensor kinase CheA